MEARYFSLCANMPVVKKATTARRNNFFIVLILGLTPTPLHPSTSSGHRELEDLAMVDFVYLFFC